MFMTGTGGEGSSIHQGYEEYLKLVQAVEKTCKGRMEGLMMFVMLGPLICIVLALQVNILCWWL